MRKRFFAAGLALLFLFMLLPLGPGTIAASPVCFISINDTLLDLGSMPYTLGGTTYVPYWVFSNFRIYYSFFTSNSTVSLYTSERQIFFDLANGGSYDSNDNHFSAQAVYVGGTVYVPLNFVCAYFSYLGISYSLIAGSGYGDVLRIKDGNSVLSDSEFISAAASLMQSRYNSYMAGSSTTPPASPKPTVSSPEPDRSDTEVYLSFQGLPTEGMLKILNNFGVNSCFFVTADEIREFPEAVRRLLGSGHGVGVLCGEDAESEYEEASSLLFEAALEKTLLVAAEPGCEEAVRELASKLSLVYWDYSIGGAVEGEKVSPVHITSKLEFSEERADIRLMSGDATEKALPSILFYLYQNKFSLRMPSEVGNPI